MARGSRRQDPSERTIPLVRPVEVLLPACRTGPAWPQPQWLAKQYSQRPGDLGQSFLKLPAERVHLGLDNSAPPLNFLMEVTIRGHLFPCSPDEARQRFGPELQCLPSWPRPFRGILSRICGRPEAEAAMKDLRSLSEAASRSSRGSGLHCRSRASAWTVGG